MNIKAVPVSFSNLKPGEVFSTQGPEVWAHRTSSIAWRVWMRGDGPPRHSEASALRYRLDVEQPVHADYSGTLYCPLCGKPVRAERREWCEPVEAEVTCGAHHWLFVIGDGCLEGFQCNEGDRR